MFPCVIPCCLLVLSPPHHTQHRHMHTPPAKAASAISATTQMSDLFKRPPAKKNKPTPEDSRGGRAVPSKSSGKPLTRPGPRSAAARACSSSRRRPWRLSLATVGYKDPTACQLAAIRFRADRAQASHPRQTGTPYGPCTLHGRRPRTSRFWPA